jgi:DNA polymerase-1
MSDNDTNSNAPHSSNVTQIAGTPPFRELHANDSSDQMWIVEERRSAEAVAKAAPDSASVWVLTSTGIIPDNLSVVSGKRVVVFPHWRNDKYAAYAGALHLREACLNEGAISADFAPISHIASLADQLGDSVPDSHRGWLKGIASRAGKKPSPTKPTAPSAAQQRKAEQLETLEQEAAREGRPVIYVSDDPQEVLDKLVKALQQGPHGERIFNLGGKLVLVAAGDEGGLVAELIEDELLFNLLADSAKMVAVGQRNVSPSWPDSKTVTALYGRVRDFRPLRGIAPAPILRADGTIAATEGYDEASQMLLDLDGLDLKIPDDPTEDDVAWAVSFLFDEWLVDFPFNAQADKANALGLTLTYPVRELCGLVPGAVISAKSAGTGKSKLLGQNVQLFTRTSPEWDSLPESDDETRKQITTLLLTAPAFLCFDECPVVRGRNINRLLTAHRWSDRRLGKSERVALPNRAVIAFTGNNVEVIGDTNRRYYPIELFYDGENPENRPASDFKHPDLEAWAEEHRGELLTAVFTLIRRWQVAGCPERATSFGSFERWEAVIGGILEVAGVEGFLGNLQDHRSEADYDTSLKIDHFEWLAEHFGWVAGSEFTTRDVNEAMVEKVGKDGLAINPTAEFPPELMNPLEPGYTTKLGKYYNDHRDGWLGGFRVRKLDKKAGGNKRLWKIEMRLEKAEEFAVRHAKSDSWLRVVREMGGDEVADRVVANRKAPRVNKPGPAGDQGIDPKQATLMSRVREAREAVVEGLPLTKRRGMTDRQLLDALHDALSEQPGPRVMAVTGSALTGGPFTYEVGHGSSTPDFALGNGTEFTRKQLLADLRRDPNEPGITYR